MRWSRFSSGKPALGRNRLGLVAALVFAAGLMLPPRLVAAPISKVKVEIGLYGVPAIADHFRREFLGKLNEALAAHPIEGFPEKSRLIVRVTSIYLAQGEDSSRAFNQFSPEPPIVNAEFSGRAPDAVEGEAVIMDAKGNVLARKRLIANFPVFGNSYIRPEYEPMRVERLMGALAYWTARAF